MKIKHFLTLLDFKPEDIKLILKTSTEFKESFPMSLRDKTVAGFFEKPSTRTRISMEVAVESMGGHFIYIDKTTTQISRGESIKDFALVLSRYVDLLAARMYSHEKLIEMAKWSNVPVINMLTDRFHPLQALADALTIVEKTRKEKPTIAFIGDGGANTCHSLMIISVKLGWNFRVGCPPQYKPDSRILDKATSAARDTGGSIKIFDDPYEAVKDVDVIYTDTWFSMGVKDIEERKKAFKNFQVNSGLVHLASKDVIVMHCQPWFLGEEITEDVAYGRHSVAFDQAENRLHTARAVLHYLVGNK